MEALNENGEPLDAGSTEGAAEGDRTQRAKVKPVGRRRLSLRKRQLEERINAMIPSTIDDIPFLLRTATMRLSR